MKKIVFPFWLIMILLSACSRSQQAETETTDAAKPVAEAQNTFTVEPFKTASPQVVAETEQETLEPTTPPVTEPTTTTTPLPEEAVQMEVTEAPLPTTSQKNTSIDVIGPAGAQIDIKVYLDEQLVCTFTDQINAQTHQRFGTLFLVKSTCSEAVTASEGLHEYQLAGQVTLPDQKTYEVSYKTGQHTLSNALKPTIEINPQGEVILRLAVG